jgi:hypothetical protein
MIISTDDDRACFTGRVQLDFNHPPEWLAINGFDDLTKSKLHELCSKVADPLQPILLLETRRERTSLRSVSFRGVFYFERSGYASD